MFCEKLATGVTTLPFSMSGWGLLFSHKQGFIHLVLDDPLVSTEADSRATKPTDCFFCFSTPFGYIACD